MRRYLAEIYFLATLSFLLLSLFFLKPAVMPFFLGSALAYISHPLFSFYCGFFGEKRRISAVLTLLSIFLVLMVALLFVIPPVIAQVQSFVSYLPELTKKLDTFLYKFLGEHFFKKFNFNFETVQSILKSAYQQYGSLPIGNLIQRLFSGVFSIISVLINTVLVPLITYYLLVNAGSIKRLYVLASPAEIKEELELLIDKVHSSLSSYLIGQMLVATFVGVYIAVGLYFVGIKYSLLIGFVAGVLNMIPYVGFFSGLIPSMLLAIFDNGELAYVVGVLIVFLTEVGIENLIYPVVMSRTTGVNPLLILLSIFVGGYLGGLLGIIIAVPVAVMVVPVFESFIEKKEKSVVTGADGQYRGW